MKNLDSRDTIRSLFLKETDTGRPDQDGELARTLFMDMANEAQVDVSGPEDLCSESDTMKIVAAFRRYREEMDKIESVSITEEEMERWKGN